MTINHLKKYFFATAFTLSTLCSSSAIAGNQNIGLGVIIGSATGISANYRLANNQSIDMVVAFNSDLYIHSTYLFHLPNSLTIDKHSFGWYYGLGVRFHDKKDHDWRNGDDEELHVGPRGAMGISIPIKARFEFEVFAEGAIILNLTPDTDVDLDAGIGGRIYF